MLEVWGILATLVGFVLVAVSSYRFGLSELDRLSCTFCDESKSPRDSWVMCCPNCQKTSGRFIVRPMPRGDDEK